MVPFFFRMINVRWEGGFFHVAVNKSWVWIVFLMFID